MLKSASFKYIYMLFPYNIIMMLSKFSINADSHERPCSQICLTIKIFVFLRSYIEILETHPLSSLGTASRVTSRYQGKELQFCESAIIYECR